MDNSCLFRAWDKRLKYMFLVGGIKWFDGKIIEIVRAETGEIYDEYDIENLVIMKCTGLHAIKSYRGESEADRLIFEGDIVAYTNRIKDGYEIVWHIDGWERKVIVKAKDGDYFDYLPVHPRSMAIIGTIYDRTEGEI